MHRLLKPVPLCLHGYAISLQALKLLLDGAFGRNALETTARGSLGCRRRSDRAGVQALVELFRGIAAVVGEAPCGRGSRS